MSAAFPIDSRVWVESLRGYGVIDDHDQHMLVVMMDGTPDQDGRGEPPYSVRVHPADAREASA